MRSDWIVAILIGLIPAGAALTAAIIVPAAFSTPIGVQITGATGQNGSIAITVELTSHRASFLSVTAAELQGRIVPPVPRPIFYVADPTFPLYYGYFTDVGAQLQRINSQLSLYGVTTTIHPVSMWELPRVLANNTDAIVVDLESGLLPSSLLYPNSTALGTWLAGGGTLIWAGGPLGFFQSVIEPHRNSVWRAGWSAQTELLGFPLVDPTGNNTSKFPQSEPGADAGTTISPVGDGLQSAYWGVSYGANTTQLSNHLGVDLGWDTGGSHPRTSLSVLPIGRGTLFYFGGGLGPYGGPPIPDAGYALAVDVARLIGSDFVPTAPVPPATVHVSLSPYSSTAVTFYRASTGPPSALMIQVTVGRQPSFFGLWSTSPASFGVTSLLPAIPGDAGTFGAVPRRS